MTTRNTAAGFLFIAGLAAGHSIAQDSILGAASVPPGSLSGMTAIRQFEGRLADIARRHSMSEAELAALLAQDLSTYITPDGRVLNVCPIAPDNDQHTDDGTPALARGGIPLDDFLSLESNPGAPKTIYLDFDGHHSVNDGWGHNIVFPAWDRSGNTGVYTDAEKLEIINTWLEVVEDFAIFSNINVRTSDPGIAALTKSSGADTTFGMRVVMTQATSGFGDGIGGVAFLNTFDESTDTPCFGFNKGLNAGPQTASHEVGHTLGLQHDGLSGSTYHPGSSGTPSWGPIMGAPFGRQLVQWSNGDYPGFTSSQNDFAVITSSANAVTIFADDHPNTTTGGTPISQSTPITGLITSASDTDAFNFSAFGGDVTIDLSTVAVGPTIDLRWSLYRNAPLELVETFSPTGTWNASKTYPALQPGAYTVVVDGTFQTQTNGPVSDYGSVGTYTIDVTQSVLLLSVSFLTTPPSLIAPDTETPISVLVVENDDTLVGSPTLSYQRAGDVSPTTLNLVDAGGGIYTGSLPEFDCGDDPSFWVSAEGVLTGVISDPFVGAYQASIGTGVDFVDNVETNIGWTVSGNAVDGQWVRGVPANFGRSDPAADFDGSGQAWLTDNAESNSDVDGGQTILTSPAFDFSTGGTVSYAYWMNDETNPLGAEDFFRVEVSLNNGSTWTTARTYTSSNQWRTDTIDVGAEFGNTAQFRMRVIAAENDPGDVLECGLDAIVFESFDCTQTNTCVADTNGDGQLTAADFSAWIAAFNAQAPECDQNGDTLCTAADFSAWIANYNAGCP